MHEIYDYHIILNIHIIYYMKNLALHYYLYFGCGLHSRVHTWESR